ncbi:MAG: type I restriction enzyme HsdR N-terminal domain-containing protein [Bacteroidales bacterium]|nr:type I restriction enzyme HsdR N-terminal domain-containing protein [Bacteroidales bacterium]
MSDYKRRLTYSEVKYGYLRIEKEYSNRCPKPGEKITIQNYEGNFKMHSTQIGRIDGLTALYKNHKIDVGNIATITFLSKNVISIGFSAGDDLLKLRQESIEKTPLLTIIENIRELISKHTYLFCRNEMNVRIEIIEPIFNALGWNLPDLNREKTCHRRRADYALYKNGECVLVIEAKAIQTNLNKSEGDQLRDYMQPENLNTKYGILTNGYLWQIRSQENGDIIKSIDIMNTEEDEKIESFFNSFSKNTISKQFSIEKETVHCKPKNWEESFSIKENNSIIKGKNPTETFLQFIETHIDSVIRLQQNNRFMITVVSSQKEDFITEPIEPKKIDYPQGAKKNLFITRYHNTYLKRMIIQQIIVEDNIKATIEPPLF